MKRGKLPQGAKWLHMGGLVLPCSGSMDRVGATFFRLSLWKSCPRSG
jgi:hypothetical protein